MLKKIASTLSVLITSMTLSGSMGYSLKASAESSFEDYLYYTLIDEDEDDTYDYALITGCRSLTQTAIIPSEIEGVPVTEISEDAFRYCYYLESVVIPETVETIEDRAFAYCYNLRDVTMPEAKLGTDVFFNTPYLENKAYDGISLNVTQLDSGKAVTLPKEIKLTDPSDRNSKQVYNPAQNGIYFINSKQIDFMSFSDGSYRNIFSTTPNIELAEAYMKKHSITPDEFEKRHSYPQVTNIYCNDEQVYILGLFDNFNPETYEYICEPVVTVYDLNKMEIEKIVFPDADISYYDYTAIGTDSQNRIYIAYSDYENNKSFIDLYSAEGQLIDSAETQYSINKFYGFDRTNGNFYLRHTMTHMELNRFARQMYQEEK